MTNKLFYNPFFPHFSQLTKAEDYINKLRLIYHALSYPLVPEKNLSILGQKIFLGCFVVKASLYR